MNKLFLGAMLFASSIGLATTAARAEGFTGWRVDLHGGYDALSSAYTVSGAMAGVGIGYDTQVSKSVTLGLEANVGYSSAKDEGVAFGVAYSQVARRDIEISARLGVIIGEGTLAFLKAGYSNAGYEGAAAGFGLFAFERGTSDGLRAGLGIEQRIANRWFAKGEYRFTRYETEDVNRNQLLLGIGYRF